MKSGRGPASRAGGKARCVGTFGEAKPIDPTPLARKLSYAPARQLLGALIRVE